MLRDDLNSANPNRIASAFQQLGLGEAVNALLGGGDVTVPVATVGADIAAFTSPPTAGEMALLRTFVNALKADMAALRTALIAVGGATEQALTVSSNVATLAAKPSRLFSVIATTATTAGMKKLLIGPITGPGAIVPATGQAVWDGNLKVLFAVADVVTVADFAYAKASDTTVSLLQREQGEVDVRP